MAKKKQPAEGQVEETPVEDTPVEETPAPEVPPQPEAQKSIPRFF